MTQAVAPHGTRRRAKRYAIVTPLRFWTSAADVRNATTIDVSSLGLLCRLSQAELPPVSTTVRFRMALSPELGWAGAHVDGTGRIVRIVPSPLYHGAIVAISIDDWALRPGGGEEPPPRGESSPEDVE